MTEPLIALPHTGLRVPHTRLKVTSLRTMPGPDGEVFTATLRLDNRIVGQIYNDGHGGATTWSTNGVGFSWRDLEAFVAACRAPDDRTLTEEFVLDDLVEEYATHRTVTKHERANRTALRLCQLINGSTYSAGQAAAAKITTRAMRERLIVELAAESPADEDEWWQLWNGTAWEDLTTRPATVATNECGCPPNCALCLEAQGRRHALECPWTTGNAAAGNATVEPLMIETPPIAPALTVVPEHMHRTGCPQMVRRPGPLFVLIDDVRMRCTVRLGRHQASRHHGQFRRHHRRLRTLHRVRSDLRMGRHERRHLAAPIPRSCEPCHLKHHRIPSSRSGNRRPRAVLAGSRTISRGRWPPPPRLQPANDRCPITLPTNERSKRCLPPTSSIS